MIRDIDKYRHRKGTGMIPGPVQHLLSCQRVPRNELLLARGD